MCGTAPEGLSGGDPYRCRSQPSADRSGFFPARFPRSSRSKKPALNRPALRWAAATWRSVPACDRHGKGSPSGREEAAQATEILNDLLNLAQTIPQNRTTASSPTDRFIYEMQVHGYRPFQDEPDPRPLPEEPIVQASLMTIFDALSRYARRAQGWNPISKTCSGRPSISSIAAPIASSAYSIAIEEAQRTGQREQDGSEVKSIELERLIAEGITLLERRNTFEFMRDHSADLFEAQTGSALAATHRLEGQPCQHDSGDDRLEGLPVRTSTCRDRGHDPGGHEDRLCRRHGTTTIMTASGQKLDQAQRQAPRRWCCCTVAHRKGQNASPPAGQKPAR